jgi:ketosteroid isomerase-like protein
MHTHRSLLERAVAVYNEGDLNGYVDLYTEDAVLTTPEGAIKGKNDLRERFARELNALSDIRFDVISYVEGGDMFADEFRLAGTHTGPLSMPDGTELPATGRHVEIRGMEMVQVRDGRMVADNLYYDNVAVFAQLGILPPRTD